jgi:hypothetical protein
MEFFDQLSKKECVRKSVKWQWVSIHSMPDQLQITNSIQSASSKFLNFKCENKESTYLRHSYYMQHPQPHHKVHLGLHKIFHYDVGEKTDSKTSLSKKSVKPK